jgi:hypothetical protein
VISTSGQAKLVFSIQSLAVNGEHLTFNILILLSSKFNLFRLPKEIAMAMPMSDGYDNLINYKEL